MTIKFHLTINNKRIRNLETLRDNFYASDILEVYKDGRLINFLKDRDHLEEIKKIELISSDLSEFEIIFTISNILSVNVRNIKINSEKEHKFSHSECDKTINDLEEKIEQLEKEKNTIKILATNAIKVIENSKVKQTPNKFTVNFIRGLNPSTQRYLATIEDQASKNEKISELKEILTKIKGGDK